MYKVLSGRVFSGDLPKERAAEVAAPLPAQKSIMDKVVDALVPHKQQPSLPAPTIFGYSSRPLEEFEKLSKGDLVVRKIRPNDVGKVVSVVYVLGSPKARLRNVWVSFDGRTDLPYDPPELERVIVQ